MSSKLTELTDSSPSAPPPSVLCGSGIHSRLASPWSMASSGHFDPGYKAVEVLDPPFTERLAKGKYCFQNFNPEYLEFHFCFVEKKLGHCPGSVASNVRRYLWSKTDGPFGKEFLVSEGPTHDSTSGYSDCSDELDGQEVEVVNNPVGHQSSTSPSQPPAIRFQSCPIPSTPRNFQPTLATIPTSLPPASPSSSHTRPAISPEVRLSPIVTSQQLQPEASSSRRREVLSHLPFPAAQVFQQRDHWPIQVTREDPNTVRKDQDAVARFFQ
ncbi:hypothetical protein O181_006458 [Austropuccinia psidii MF-1]|uniref:Uncharacterized protein n=1 Tax=Austropuccinia psidii MF-1 TaxID=1389203 RepID=A0A9Q3BK97_9BASI|nr:hypothetical protein [Austropuccinia psidii MF-1]